MEEQIQTGQPLAIRPEVAKRIDKICKRVRGYCFPGQAGTYKFGLEDATRTWDEVEQYVKRLVEEQWDSKNAERGSLPTVFFNEVEAASYIMMRFCAEYDLMDRITLPQTLWICSDLGKGLSPSAVARGSGHPYQRIASIWEDHSDFIAYLREYAGEKDDRDFYVRTWKDIEGELYTLWKKFHDERD